MMNFCTLFNSFYIHKGIATYLSLEKLTEDFHLYIVAFDKECYDKLRSLHFKHMTVELIDDFESPELLAIKPSRTMAEYCWTCSASVTYFFLKKYNLPDITYIDSDLYFLTNPKILFDELKGYSIGLSEHWHTHPNSRAGRFCVQFVYFRNNKDGLSALEYWKDKCIEWCFARYEDGKFGDQSYMQDIFDNYSSVHAFDHRGCGVAQWNDRQYQYPNPGRLLYKGTEYPIVFYHMHGMRFVIKDQCLRLETANYDVHPGLRGTVFNDYAWLVADVFNRYLNKKVTSVKVVERPVYIRTYTKLREMLSNSRLVRYFYYNVFHVTYTGHEKQKQI